MNDSRLKLLSQLVSNLGLQDLDLSLIDQALIHPSYVYENSQELLSHNQRLEFLGDAVIGLIIGEYLYQTYPEKSEGELTKMRAAVVCESSLAKTATNLGLGNLLLMGKGEEQSGGSTRPSNLADSFEALMAAVYITKGINCIRPIVLDCLMDSIKKADRGDYGDFKTQLQEFIQKKPENKVSYKILEELGPDHAKEFIAGVMCNDALVAKGQGRTKKEAEQNAARQALIHYGLIRGE